MPTVRCLTRTATTELEDILFKFEDKYTQLENKSLKAEVERLIIGEESISYDDLSHKL